MSWRDNQDNDITDGEGGYTISQGSVDENQFQEATLTFALGNLSYDMQHDINQGVAYFKCAAKSIKYPESPRSEFKELQIELNFLGEYHILKESQGSKVEN